MAWLAIMVVAYAAPMNSDVRTKAPLATLQLCLLITSPKYNRKYVQVIKVVINQCLLLLGDTVFRSRQDGRD